MTRASRTEDLFLSNRLTAHARTILNLARREASKQQASEVADQHILAAMLRAEEPGVGQSALRNLGVDPRAMVDALDQIKSSTPHTNAPHRVGMSDATRQLLRVAHDEAQTWTASS